ncbi:MAG: hypothetical protein Q8O26_08290 [Phreatobacter sp.]|uniref:hypothetical protein n=1 Tax=Phreatobacter sp. TaxID=1966341 RepID=UPI002735AA48|nr:hypothetical protein [Phreatobacter sp.]MDP2801866.1 hypothetical protein [Phreatobacter sp.]
MGALAACLITWFIGARTARKSEENQFALAALQSRLDSYEPHFKDIREKLAERLADVPDFVASIPRLSPSELREKIIEVCTEVFQFDLRRDAGRSPLPALMGTNPEKYSEQLQQYMSDEKHKRDRETADFQRNYLPRLLALEQEIARRLGLGVLTDHFLAEYRAESLRCGFLVGSQPAAEIQTYLLALAGRLQ